MNNLDTDLLISLVEKKEVLWNTADEDYKDKNKKNSAWVEITSTLFTDFATKLESEQKIMLHEVVSKWRTVRDNYMRTLKKQKLNFKWGSGKSVRSYIYGKQLSFLKKTVKPYETRSSIEVPNTKTEVTHQEAAQTVSDTSEFTDTLVTSKKRKRQCNNLDNKIIGFMESQNKSTPESDEHLAFFYSILPTLRSLDSDKIFTFRIKTMQLLQSLKSQN